MKKADSMRHIVILLICMTLFAFAGEVFAQCEHEVTRTENINTYYGQSVAIIGDIDGDFVDDYIVGAPNDAAEPQGSADLGRAYVYSGADFQGGSALEWMGQYFAEHEYGK